MKKYYNDLVSTIIGLIIIGVWGITLSIVIIDIIYIYAM